MGRKQSWSGKVRAGLSSFPPSSPNVLVSQLCLTLCNSMDCSPPGSSMHGLFQARILEWVAIPFSRGSSWPKDQIQVSRIAVRLFEPPGKPLPLPIAGVNTTYRIRSHWVHIWLRDPSEHTVPQSHCQQDEHITKKLHFGIREWIQVYKLSIF